MLDVGIIYTFLEKYISQNKKTSPLATAYSFNNYSYRTTIAELDNLIHEDAALVVLGLYGRCTNFS
jgi:hypothetical protein